MVTGFFATNIDSDEDEEEDQKEDHFEQKYNLQTLIGNLEIVQLKKNYIPKGLIPLEKLCYHNDAIINPTLQPQVEDIEEVNLGTLECPKMVKISKSP
jgi:hypothetical protein